MSDVTGVRVTVINPEVVERDRTRTGACQLLVEAAKPLPRAPYSGTVRIGGAERTATGVHPCRLLKHYTIERIQDEPSEARYALEVDLGDEGATSGPAYVPPGFGIRSPDEPIEIICKRIAGVFGRYCEEFRPPSVVVELGE